MVAMSTVGTGARSSPKLIGRRGDDRANRGDGGWNMGLRACDKLTREDYREILEPVLTEAIESGEIRLVLSGWSFS